MTAPSPRLRTAWRVGSALAAAAGSAVVTSALVNRTRNRSQRKAAAGPTGDAPAPTPLETPAPPVGAPVPPPVTEAEAPPAGGVELTVHDPAPARPPDATAPSKPALTHSDSLARAIEAADAVEAAPAAWRAASDLRAQAGDNGWTPPATAVPSLGDMRGVPPGPPTPAVGTAAAIVADAAIDGSPAWDYGLSDVDTRVPRPPGQEDRRRPRRRNHTAPDTGSASPAGAPARTGAATVAGAPAPPVDDPSRPQPPPGGPDAPAGPGGPGGPGGEVAPDRRLLLFIGVAVAVTLLLGLGVVVLGGADDSPDRTDAAADDGTRAGTGTSGAPGSQPATTPVAQLTPAQAFTQAGQRLQTAGTFAYEGTSSATDVSPVRPGPWMGVDLTVEGQVQLTPARLLERGTANDGTTGETVSDGVTIWGRSAPSADALAELTVQTLYTLPDPTPARVGGLLLPQWLTSATGAVDAGRDSLGRRTFRATLPASVLGSIEDDAAPVDAVLVLALAPNGDPAHLEVTTASGPPLRLVYDLVRLGQPTSIPIPGQPTTGSTGSTAAGTTGTGQAPTSTTAP